MRIHLTVAVSLLFISCAAPSAKNTTPAFDEILRAAVEQKRVPGVVAAVATPGALTYQGAFNVDKDAIFAIASMTKPVTSVAVMQLVEQGKIKLDEPAATYVPEIAKVQVLENGKLRPPKSAPTIRQLLTHTAGFSYEIFDPGLQAYVAAGKAPSMMAGGDGVLSQPMVADPGTRWIYGTNTDWLGRIVERVSGQNLEQYFHDKIFVPLGMKDSSFVVPEASQSRLAARFQRKPDGTLEQAPPQPVKPPAFFSGGGGLFSTAADYLRFTRALLRDGELDGARILSAASVAAMRQNQIGDLQLQSIPSLVPQLARDRARLPGAIDKFGLGFALNSKPAADGRAPDTMSWAGLYNTYFWIDPGKKLTAVVFMQLLPFGDENALQLVEDVGRAAYAAQ
jgi:CubicO group peptidase (beta-lactamase class C family)